MVALPILLDVKISRMLLRLALLPAVLFIGAGCSGVNASHSISPLMFLLPGFAEAAPQNNSIPEPIATAEELEPEKVLARLR